MTVEQIRSALAEAAKLRVPEREPNEVTSVFLDRLGDYLLRVSVARGNLEEARIHAYAAVEVLEDRWEAVEGWEAIAGARNATQAQKDDAKRQIDPATWQGLKDGRRLVARLSDQIKRLGGLADDEAVSRAYSIFTAG